MAALAALIGVIGQIAVCRLAMGSGASVGESIRNAAGRALPLIGATLLIAVPMVLIIGLIVSMAACLSQRPITELTCESLRMTRVARLWRRLRKPCKAISTAA